MLHNQTPPSVSLRLQQSKTRPRFCLTHKDLVESRGKEEENPLNRKSRFYPSDPIRGRQRCVPIARDQPRDHEPRFRNLKLDPTQFEENERRERRWREGRSIKTGDNVVLGCLGK
ncbi:hypothetical protein EUGRSUZ_H02263 [Eucalyptus grandis]|uniref:Uncharacterized protein n=2 Tax=Eucalyptus grandis TaxID=71139 RepID=A0ACC3JS98_EUCGR|nr:hypothetical protein EUGRSUZ_H02263 [Eucalyptus grandis]